MAEAAEVKRKSVRGVVSYSVRTGLVYVIALVATGLLSAYLTPAEFGVFFVVTAIISFFSFLSDVGLAAALVQKKDSPTLTELRAAFTAQQGLALLILLIIVGLTPVWIDQIHLNQEGIWLLYALGFSFFLASLKTIPSILLERELEFQKLALPTVVEQLVFYGVVVYLAYQGWGVTSFTLGVLTRGVTGLVVIYGLKRWSIGFSLDRKALKGLLKFGIKFQINDLLARLKDDLYFIVLAKFLPVTAMGYLGWAKRWSMFPYQFSVQNIIAVTFPTLARIQEDKPKVGRGLEVSAFFISLVIFPLLVGMVLLAGPLIRVIPAYMKWLPALPALYLFCLNIALASVANPLINALNAMGKIGLTLKLMTVMTLITWLLTPLAVSATGFTGVAAIAAASAAISLVSYLWVKKSVPLRLGSQIKIPLIASLMMGVGLGLSQRWLQPTFGALLAQIGLGVTIYVGAVLGGGRRRLKENLGLVFPGKKWPFAFRDQASQ